MNFSGLSGVRSLLPPQILSSACRCTFKPKTCCGQHQKSTLSRILNLLLRFYMFPVKLADCQMIFSRSRRPSTFCLLPRPKIPLCIWKCIIIVLRKQFKNAKLPTVQQDAHFHILQALQVDKATPPGGVALSTLSVMRSTSLNIRPDIGIPFGLQQTLVISPPTFVHFSWKLGF